MMTLFRPSISVVLPVYNAEDYLRESIPSILAQDIEFELVISDDGSKDRTLQIVDGFADPRIRVLRNNPNAKTFGNLNRCIQAARGNLIQVFSHDDVMLPGYLAAQAALLAKYPDAGLVYNSPVYIDAAGRRQGVDEGDTTPERIEWPLYRWIASHYGAICASISSIMIPRRTFETVGLFDPSFPFAGDIEFYNRVAERFVIIRNVEPLHAVRGHAGATSAQSTSGSGYLGEEQRMSEWYRRQWSEEDWRKVRHFRSDLRGRYHLGWIRRAAMRGRLDQALRGLWSVNRIYPLTSILYWRARSLMQPHRQSAPTIAPPRRE